MSLLRELPHADSAALAAHVVRIGRENTIRIVFDSALNGFNQPGGVIEPTGTSMIAADREFIKHHCAVHVPIIVNHRTYAVSLHELGHILSERGWLSKEMEHAGKVPTPRNLILQMEEEVSAWKWAKDHALVWNGEMQQFSEWSLNTYSAYHKIMAGLLSLRA